MARKDDLYDRELERYRETLRLDPEVARERYGVSLVNSLNPAERALALRTMGMDVKDPVDFYNLGCHFASEDNWSEAIMYFKRTVELDPSMSHAIYNLALCYEKTGHVPQAKSTWEVYLQTLDQDTEEFRRVSSHVKGLN